MNSRSIKIENTGDFFKRKTFPKIRLQGKWLAALAFTPNGRVIVQPTATGELLLKFCPPTQSPL